MPFLDLSPEQLHQLLAELDQALFHHDQWCEGLNRTLICRLEPDHYDVAKESFRHCRFGQWLYGSGASSLAHHPALAEIETRS